MSSPTASATADDVGGEPVERVRGGIGRLVALAVAAVVEGDDRACARSVSTWSAKSSFAPPKPCTSTTGAAEAAVRGAHPDLEPDAVVGDHPHVPITSSPTTRRAHRYFGVHRWPALGPRARVTRRCRSRARNLRAWRFPRRPRRAATRWRLWLRMVVSAVLLAILVVKISSDERRPVAPRPRATLAFLVAGLLLMCGGIVLSAWRWQRVLAVFDARVPLPTLTEHYLAGQFVGNVLPSTIGGDVLRISRSSKDVGARDMAFASVVLERLTGFVALPLLIFVGFLARPVAAPRPGLGRRADRGRHARVPVRRSWFSPASPRLAGRFAENENWMRFIGVVHVGVDRLRRDPRDALGGVGTCRSPTRCRSSLSVFCVGPRPRPPHPERRGPRVRPRRRDGAGAPDLVGGLGVREGVLVLFLHPLGVRNRSSRSRSACSGTR